MRARKARHAVKGRKDDASTAQVPSMGIPSMHAAHTYSGIFVRHIQISIVSRTLRNVDVDGLAGAEERIHIEGRNRQTD